MITKIKQILIPLTYSIVSNMTFSKTGKPRMYFIAHTLWLFASIKGRINFLQLGCFSKFCQQYCNRMI